MFSFGGIWTMVLYVRKAVDTLSTAYCDRLVGSMENSGAENGLSCGEAGSRGFR